MSKSAPGRSESRNLTQIVGVRFTPEAQAAALELVKSRGAKSLPELIRHLLDKAAASPPMPSNGAPRVAGSPWRLLVHDYLGRKGQRETGFLYGKSHHIQSDPEMGRLPASILPRDPEAEAERAERTTVVPGTEFDELVVGRWIHIEQMDTGYWWMNIGGVTVHVTADRDGRPKHVMVHGPRDYAQPVKGCTYSLDWDGEGFDSRSYPEEKTS